MSEAERYAEQFREDFIRNLRLDFFDDEEIGAVLESLEALDRRIRQKAFALCHTLSHASSSLVPNTLKRIRTASVLLSPKDLERWLTHAYDLLDHQGAGPFVDFFSKIDEDELARFRTPRGLKLQTVLPVIETYLKGISGLDLRVAGAQEPYTDTASVYLPFFINRYERKEENFHIYKLMTCHAWAQIARGTVIPDDKILGTFIGNRGKNHPDIGTLFGLFAEQELAEALYTVIEAVRLGAFLNREFPGLMRGIEEIKRGFLRDRPAIPELSEKVAFVEGLYQAYLQGVPASGAPKVLETVWEETEPLKKDASSEESLKILFDLYRTASTLAGEYRPKHPMPFPAVVKPRAVSLQIKGKQRARRQKIDAMITRLISMPEFEPRIRPSAKGMREEKKVDPEREYLLIKGRLLELDAEQRETLEERGGVPGGILVKGADAGAPASPITLAELYEEDETIQETAGGISYDEWDYKRGGYKKKWCTLREKSLHPGHEPFVALTLQRYSGSVSVLRKKFELLKKEPKILRRQKDGDDIDLDAVVEAFSDISAGRSPREDLFTHYDRQERNIAVLFLLDMSGSTKGWINKAEKESLVLMAEALETLGDRYAIYGFSGMTRNKCDFYLIKGFDEPFAKGVKNRISGIEPKDYTRMGPPIRHAMHLLKKVEARTKLMITLSDGKPEDYDAYKGNYGIEDTRKALIEAKEQGIHAFCITIDQEAASYLRRMYGEGRYIVIDDVMKLPHRITEIYRRLTT